MMPDLLLGLLFLMAAAGGAAVALNRKPHSQVYAMAFYGTALSLLFLALQGPDVALSEIVVGGAAVPALFLITIRAERALRRRRGEHQ